MQYIERHQSWLSNIYSYYRIRWYLLKVLGRGRVRDAGAGHLKRPMQTLPDDNRKILKDATAAFPVTFHLLLGGWMDHMIGVLTSQTVSANFVSSQSAVLL